MRLIKFHDGDSPRKGYQIGNSLVVAGTREGYHIYRNVQSRNLGGPAVDLLISTQEDAVKIAEWLDGLFENYLELFGCNPPPPDTPFGLAKWHSEKHLSAYCLLSVLEEYGLESPITTAEFQKKENLEKARSRILWWKGNVTNWEVDVKGRLGVQ